MLENKPQDSSLRQMRGISLVELLVGLAVGTMILAASLTLFAKISFSGLENTRRVQLNEQLRSTLNLIHKDLQRAGYVDAADGAATVADVDTVQMALFGVITIGDAPIGTDNCIIYSYDFDGDNVQDDDEVFGFRHHDSNGDGVNDQVQRDTTLAACDVADGWTGITDDTVVVQTLSFSDISSTYYEISRDGDGDEPCEYGGDFNGVACVDTTPCESTETCLERRKIDVLISGYVAQENPANASTLVVSLSDQIKVKNDRYYLVP